jgi:AraC-like DNA-binding protein
VLSATSTRTFGTSTLQTTVFLERRLRVHLVTRDRLLYDTAFGSRGKAPGQVVHLYVTMRGMLQISGAPPLAGPHAFALAETEFDHVVPGARTFRSFGAPCEIIELRVPAADLGLPVGLDRGALGLPPSVWDAYHELARTRDEAAVHRVIEALGAAGILSRALTASVVTTEPERFVRIWSAMKPLYGDLATSTSLKQVAVIAGLSLRQLGRDLRDFTDTFNLYGGGFREAMRVLRLRAAVTLLSAPEGSPRDVARAVGYGSLDAMGRAFRDAHLPAPSIVQEAVRYRDPL